MRYLRFERANKVTLLVMNRMCSSQRAAPTGSGEGGDKSSSLHQHNHNHLTPTIGATPHGFGVEEDVDAADLPSGPADIRENELKERKSSETTLSDKSSGTTNDDTKERVGQSSKSVDAGIGEDVVAGSGSSSCSDSSRSSSSSSSGDTECPVPTGAAGALPHDLHLRPSHRSRAKLVIDGAYLEASLTAAGNGLGSQVDLLALLSLLEDRLEVSFEKKVLYQGTPGGQPNNFHRLIALVDGAHVAVHLQPLKSRTVTLDLGGGCKEDREILLDKGVDLALALEILEPLESERANASPTLSSSSLASAATSTSFSQPVLVVLTGDEDMCPVMERAERVGYSVVVCGGRKSLSEKLHPFVRKGAGQAIWLEDLLDHASALGSGACLNGHAPRGVSTSARHANAEASPATSVAPRTPLMVGEPAGTVGQGGGSSSIGSISGAGGYSHADGGLLNRGLRTASPAGPLLFKQQQQQQQQHQPQYDQVQQIQQQHAVSLQHHHRGGENASGTLVSPQVASAAAAAAAAATGLGGYQSLHPSIAASLALNGRNLPPSASASIGMGQNSSIGLGLNPKQKLYRCPQGRFCDKLDEPGHLRALRHPCPKGSICAVALSVCNPGALGASGVSDADRREHMLTFVHICPKGTACPRNDIEHCTHFDHPYRRTKARCPEGGMCPFIARGVGASNSSAREHSRLYRHPCPRGSTCPLLAGKQPSEKKRCVRNGFGNGLKNPLVPSGRKNGHWADCR